jgi:L-2-hydroxyglutarate oxidase LhgO
LTTPLSSTNADYVICGAGIVGLTLAYELNRRQPKAKILILEKEPMPGLHASGRNSGVLHSGIYYAPDTLKARLCANGARQMKSFAREHHIPMKESGKIIAATSEAEIPSLDRLMTNARENNIKAERLDSKALLDIEPHATAALEGIHCPETAVIDSKAVLKKLVQLLMGRGVEIHWNEKIVHARHGESCVITKRATYSYGMFFNCAGAYADVVARLFGLSQDYTLIPFKGIYYKLNPAKDHLVKNSIYPVPNLFLPFLGVHFTRVVDGAVYVGPTAIPAFGRENYQFWSGLNLSELVPIGRQLLRMYWNNQQNFRYLVHSEFQKYAKSAFLRAAQKLVPEITSDDLIPSPKVGIRPQLINNKEGRLEMDFLIETGPRSLHVLNAISPAFTSSFAFAEHLANTVQK